MLRWMVRTAGFMVCLMAAQAALAQTEFSADMVNTAKDGSPVQGKIYFAKDKMRFESAQTNQRGMGGAMIMNLATQTSMVIMDQQHMYMEMPAQMASQRAAYNFFRTGDAEAACADYLQQARNKGGSCHKVGSETVNGRSTVKYEGTNANGESSTFWIDPKLRFPVKWQGKNSGGELRNIQEGAQPASLFEIPAGYTKMDVGGMMKRPQ
ncbi:MAG TPA: hypothetical protein VJ999_13080 [Candidatus Sulfotelmatobacter sp.]|nr:hypothetical protein [Candidatus Sulfotelmatobacter sp.]